MANRESNWRLAALGAALIAGCGRGDAWGYRHADGIVQHSPRPVFIVAEDTVRGVVCYGRDYYAQALSCVKVKP